MVKSIDLHDSSCRKRRTVLVTLDDNTTIETTPDHIFYAYESNPHGPKEKLCPAKDLLGLYVFKDGKDLVRVESVEPQEGPVFVYDFGDARRATLCPL